MAMETPRVVISAFTEEQVERLTGVTVRQLKHWDKTGFFAPSLAYDDRSQAYSRLYSFRDLLSLKILNSLRNDAKVPLPHLRAVKDKLEHLGEDLWSKTTLYVLNRRVIFDNPITEAKEEVLSGQGVLQIPLKVITGDMNRAVEKMRERDKSLFGRIESKRGIANSKPVVAGTRIPVASVKAFADAGYTVEEIIKEYPTLTPEDIAAAIRHGAAA
ncbi:DUF433 domain-containing protein [Rhizobium aethiopicum]|uniref:Uncharacterized protein (DUF433 family) n=1 Tax=Rhizobium aethiopicum TaxID=1138170 RepID=A0A7W6VRK0_9HYPH|nr:DUF433 domain-containing protein [Rhizobium aethiopicum]MBB4194861.1 uncharacterized protein (DUF433 family) [Rhizobium aethiopicum]